MFIYAFYIIHIEKRAERKQKENEPEYNWDDTSQMDKYHLNIYTRYLNEKNNLL